MENKAEKQDWAIPKLVKESNWEKFRDLRLRAVEDSPQAFGDTAQVTQLRTEVEWREWAKSAYQFVIENNNRYVSSVTLRQDVDGIWIVNAAWTAPEFRGQGLSRKLFKKVFEKAKELNVNGITLNVNALQIEAIELYKDLGFEEKTRQSNQTMGDGSTYQTITMEIQLP